MTGSDLLADPAQYTVVVDGITCVVPCASAVLFLDDTDDAGLQEWHDRALAALGPALTHYRALAMGGRQRVTPRARGLLASWMARPAPGTAYYLEFYGCPAEAGVTGAGLSLHWVRRTWADKPPERRAKWMESWRTLAADAKDVRRALPCTVLRVAFPLGHPLAAPDALWDWVRDLSLVREGRFASGYAGLALNFDPYASSAYRPREADERLAALCLRHPGFDWHDADTVDRRLLPYEPALHDHVPLVKRANWLTLVSERTVHWLGGATAVGAAAAGAPGTAVAVDRLGGGALALRAGAAPAAGNVARGDVLPAYRAVAGAVRPARLDAIEFLGEGFPDDRAQAWLEAFDTDPDAAP